MSGSRPRAICLGGAARLESYPDLSGVRLFEEVRAAGYTGGLTQLKLYVTQVRPGPAPEPPVRSRPNWPPGTG